MKVDSRMLPADAYVKNRYSSVLPGKWHGTVGQ